MAIGYKKFRENNYLYHAGSLIFALCVDCHFFQSVD